MNEKELFYIITIAQEKSIQAAATKLYISQPALSKMLTKIENNLNTKLFHRKSTGVILTEAGEKYYNTALKICKLYNELKTELNDLDNQLLGSITLGITPYLSSSVLAHILNDFSKTAPNANIKIVEHSSLKLTSMLRRGELDLAILNCNTSEIGLYNNITYNNIYINHFLLIFNSIKANEIKPLNNLENFSSLRNHDFILTPPHQTSRTVVDSIFHSYNFYPNIAFESKNYHTILNLVSKNLGVSIIPELYYNLLNTHSNVLSIPTDKKWQVCILTQSSDYLSSTMKAFINTTKSYFNTL